MRLPWATATHTPEESQAAEARVVAVRAHLSILLRELQDVLDRIEDKRRRGMPE